MKNTLLKALFALLFFYSTGLGQPSQEILLSHGPNSPNLHLAITYPEGWMIQWYSDHSSNVARIYQVASEGRIAVVIAQSLLPRQFIGKSADETYNEVFFHDLSRMLHSTAQKRVQTDFWNGALFEYPHPSLQIPGKAQVFVKNWMMISNESLVQFQCYYFLDPNVPTAGQGPLIAKLDATFTALLRTVRKQD